MPAKAKENEEVVTEGVKPVAKAKIAEKPSYKAYAEFEFRRKAYKVGENFTPPEDLKLDAEFSEFRTHANRKGKEQKGTAFTYDVITENKDSMGGLVEERNARRVVLPVE